MRRDTIARIERATGAALDRTRHIPYVRVTCELDDAPSKYSICASSMGHVVPISSPMLSQAAHPSPVHRVRLHRGDGQGVKAADVKEHYRGLVGARKR